MKKILSLICVTAMSFSLIACGGNTKKTTGETVVETEALETTMDTETAETKEVVMMEEYKVVEADPGQYVQINAKYGSYQVTVTGAEEVDWWFKKHGNHVKHVVLVHYEVKNINFESILSDGVLLDPDSFRVTGDNDYQGKPFNTYYDGYEAGGTAAPGETVTGTFAYEIDNPNRMPEYYNIVFKNSSGDIAKFKTDLK